MARMSELAAARREESAAIAALLITGQGLRRVLEAMADDDQVPLPYRIEAAKQAEAWLDGCRRYAQASAARAIARQTPVPRPDRRPTRRRQPCNRSDNGPT